MGFLTVHLKRAVAATVLILASAAPLHAETAPRLDEMMTELSRAEGPAAKRIAREIEIEWSKSGSASANLLLRRGEEALDAKEYQAAVEHFTALTDHAPEFAEGWHGRARAFYAMDEFGLALHDIQRTLALNPKHFSAIFGLGAIFEQIGKPEEAYDSYKILLNLYPAHEKAREALNRLENQVNGTKL